MNTKPFLIWALLAGAAGCGSNQLTFPDVPETGPLPPAPDAAAEAARPDPFQDIPFDPGFVGARLLSNTEYDFTVRDLLGVTSTPVPTFPPSNNLYGFDNPGFYPLPPEEVRAHYPPAAETLAKQVFADPGLRGRIVTCTPDSPDARSACATDIVRAFGRRAFRRPLAPSEVDALVAEATNDPVEDFVAAIQRIVTQMLSSPRFLYRIEVDPEPASKVPHPVTPYELASRLSYLVWSTMPDATLFDLAKSGELAKPEVLAASLKRMLADQRSDRFMRNFGLQWMGLNDLPEHTVDPIVFPTYSYALEQSMMNEATSYLQEFMRARSFGEFLTADVNFVDAPLAALYGFSGLGPDDRMVRVEVTEDKRRGFLGLAAWLTLTSHPTRTSSMLRGRSVLNRVLCIELDPPPTGVPPLTSDAPPANATYRQQVEWISTQIECASCHRLMDPIGLGLDDFDGIGRYRTTDNQGRVLDVTGRTPDGTTFNGGGELGPALAKDPRTFDCAARNFLVYATGRGFGDLADAAIVSRLASEWKANARFEALFEPVVMSALFRTRRGGTFK